jgi:transposase/predicted nucleic acid-binding Zn finger protein
MTDAREQRGLEIAALAKVSRREDGVWIVPSQSGKGRYAVRLGVHASDCYCNCPDHELRGEKCKHMFAVEYTLRRERHDDGSETVTESVTISKSVNRPTYAQDWPAYNAAQTNEKRQFQSLLFDLCRDLETPAQGKGRPRLPLSDAVFAVTFKIYSTFSGRRFISDLCDAQAKGFLSRVPHFNSIFNYLDDAAMTDTLAGLIRRSSLPMNAIESDFAVDSTGFTTSRFVRWYDHKYNAIRQQHDWVKAHMICGVKTNAVTAVEIHDRDASDTKILPSLVRATAENFTLREVSADKGYSGINNTNVIAALGATPYIAFKSIHTGRGGGLWEKMFHYFSFRRDEFLNHYHKRSNVESTVMMIKTKFGDGVRSKTDLAMKNEVLAKVLCHNICCLIGAMHELGIQPDFHATEPA